MSTKIAKKLKSLPTSPGVYIFRNDSGKILYVGKATSLKDRVGSYFVGVQFIEPGIAEGLMNQTPTNLRMGSRPIEMFISQVADIEVRKTETVLEAYILEQGLIKKWQPKFNVDGKDDKSFSYVAITKEDFPRILFLRKREMDQDVDIKSKFSKIYGPYISKKNIEIALKILRKIFPYHSKAQKTESGCLDFQIGLCPGPYAGAISKEDYMKNIRGIRMILEGKKKTLLAKMKKEMSELSEKQEFEKAGKMRNAIFALQHIRDIALISEGRDVALPRLESNERQCANQQCQDEAVPRLYKGDAKSFRIEGYDISNISGKSSVGSMVVFDNANGEIGPNKSQYRKFKIKTIEGANDTASMAEVLGRRFGNNWPMPDLIILDGGQGHLTAVRRVLKNFHLEIPLLAVAKGPTRKKLDRYSFGSVPEISDEIIERVRDEAHRFAITYHKKLRGKSFME
ncbi:MAG: UvrB/UvrC motif-containing protein [Parcubacteria group bacterium]